MHLLKFLPPLLPKEATTMKMESLEDEKLVQMVRDFIESTDSTPISSSSTTSLTRHQSQYKILQSILMNQSETEIEVSERIMMIYTQTEPNVREEANSMKKSMVLKLKMLGYDASLCKTFGQHKVFEFAGDYEYIDVMIKDSKNGEKPTRLIVDIEFKCQFYLARPTKEYKEITEILPNIFVGSEEKLRKVISLLCSAARESMKERGLHVPPWRKSVYMQSKWLSSNCKRVPVLPNRELGKA